MDGTKGLPVVGMYLKGKKGIYRLTRKIGHGGNGLVFSVDVIEKSKKLSEEESYVIKY